jgi:hypothetical protein
MRVGSDLNRADYRSIAKKTCFWTMGSTVHGLICHCWSRRVGRENTEMLRRCSLAELSFGKSPPRQRFCLRALSCCDGCSVSALGQCPRNCTVLALGTGVFSVSPSWVYDAVSEVQFQTLAFLASSTNYSSIYCQLKTSVFLKLEKL